LIAWIDPAIGEEIRKKASSNAKGKKKASSPIETPESMWGKPKIMIKEGIISEGRGERSSKTTKRKGKGRTSAP